MKRPHCLLVIALVVGLIGVAKADPVDFHMVVLDPFATTPIFNAPFQFTFGACSAGQLPTNVNGSYEGCFSGVNRTGTTWTGLQLAFSNTAPLGSQPAGCALDGSTDYFQSATCNLSTDHLKYVLDFTIGTIPNNGSFVIAEDGVSPSDFPLVSATVTTPVGTAVTPEPSTMVLLSTGILTLGLLLLRRRDGVLQGS